MAISIMTLRSRARSSDSDARCSRSPALTGTSPGWARRARCAVAHADLAPGSRRHLVVVASRTMSEIPPALSDSSAPAPPRPTRGRGCRWARRPAARSGASPSPGRSRTRCAGRRRAVGSMVRAVGQAQGREHLRGSCAGARRAPWPASTIGTSTFSKAVSRGTRWNDWKTKPMRRARTSASASVEFRRLAAVEQVAARRRPVEQADDVEQASTCRSRSAHDRDVLAAGDGERHVVERAAPAARPPGSGVYAPELDHGPAASAPRRPARRRRGPRGRSRRSRARRRRFRR